MATTTHDPHQDELAASAEIDTKATLAIVERNMRNLRLLTEKFEAGGTVENIFHEYAGPKQIPVTREMVAEAAHAVAVNAATLRDAYRAS